MQVFYPVCFFLEIQGKKQIQSKNIMRIIDIIAVTKEEIDTQISIVFASSQSFDFEAAIADITPKITKPTVAMIDERTAPILS